MNVFDVSFWTRAWVISVAIFLSSAALADSVQESEQALSQAQNAYFNAIMQSNTLSAKDHAQLYNQMVAPAESKLSQSMAKVWTDTIQSRLDETSSMDRSKSPASRMLAKKRTQLSGGTKTADETTPATDENTALNSSAKTGNTVAQHPKSETVLDGSGIKPILDFPGKKSSQSPASGNP